jgi:hypothetical protein
MKCLFFFFSWSLLSACSVDSDSKVDIEHNMGSFQEYTGYALCASCMAQSQSCSYTMGYTCLRWVYNMPKQAATCVANSVFPSSAYYSEGITGNCFDQIPQGVLEEINNACLELEDPLEIGECIIDGAQTSLPSCEEVCETTANRQEETCRLTNSEEFLDCEEEGDLFYSQCEERMCL